jgi:protein-tyrosine phosphatase
MNFCDLHTHVLPDVDDGAASLDQSLEMLKNAVCSDVSALALTPHFYLEREEDLEKLSEFRRAYDELVQAYRGPELRLFLGAEVHVTPLVYEAAGELPLPTLNGSRYLLTEFPFYFPEDAYERVLATLLENGFVPIVAHPERYEAVMREPSLARRFVDAGAHLQLTAQSLTGSFGRLVKSLSCRLLEQDLVCCVASDAHDTRHRSNFLMEAYDLLRTGFSPEYARILMWENPMRILNDQDL